MSGFIQLHRKLLEWEWWDDHNTTRVFLYCILKANWKPNKWKGLDISRGQFPTGLDTLSKEIGLSKQQIRTCLKKLQKSGNINTQSTNKFTILTVENYDFYQSDNIQSTHKSTHEQQTNNKQITTLEKGNKENKVINNIIRPSDVSIQVWDDFINHRKAKKAKVTQTALDGIIREANKAGWPLEDALQEICSRGWTGFKAEWVNKDNRKEKYNDTADELRGFLDDLRH